MRERGVAVLVAPPGAGKTTRVPGALLDAGLGNDIVVLQPRRLAARLAAARVAHERGVRLGDEVGYEVRFDRQVSKSTKIRFLTEGILGRRLLSDPQLRGTDIIVIDEFHERHLDADLALALVERLRRTTRPDLKLIVMSATLDADAVATFLGAPVVHSQGRAFAVDVEYDDVAAEPDRPIGARVSAAIRRVLPKDDGDILVFLPGAGEIRRVQGDLAELAATHNLLVVPLHGELPADQQDRAVSPASQRKVILSTNVAETSVTIDGVTVVIDTGTARIARQSPWTGLSSLQVEPISRASATQRAGRAGRTRPGRCLRLYTRHDFDHRRAFDAAEVTRTDLAELVLHLRGLGVNDPTSLAWFEAPPTPALNAAASLLLRLGAIDDEAGPLTAIGREMLRFPAHPRVARMLLEAETRGVVIEGSLIAASLSARELRVERRDRRAARAASPSDLIDDLDAMLNARRAGMRADNLRREGLDVGTAMTVDRAATQLAKLCDARTPRPKSEDDVDHALQLAILTGFPDRVGKRRSPRSAEIVFAGGGSATLAPTSSVVDALFMVAVEVAETGDRGQKTRATIRRASAIDPAWLLDLYLDRIDDIDTLTWNAGAERVERTRRMSYDGLIIDEQVDPGGARQRPDEAAVVLANAALDKGLEHFVAPAALAQWRARVALVAKHAPDAGIALPDDAQLAALLSHACTGLISFAELRKVNLVSLLDAGLGDKRALIDRLAPTHTVLAHKRRVEIHYETEQPPWIASRMQDFFGVARPPTVIDGRVPLVLHLLAPNQRPVQVTQDLPGFWIKHYPALRRQLMRRYPRHGWPEDPTVFLPPGE